MKKILILTFVCCLLATCNRGDQGKQTPSSAPDAAPTAGSETPSGDATAPGPAPAEKDAPGTVSGDRAATEADAGNETDQFFSPNDYAGAHILVAYKGAMRAKAEITRTKEEAFARAKELIAKINQEHPDFGELAKTESDGPSASKGGDLGEWTKGRMVPEFDAAVATLEVDQITSEPVETSFGYHIIKRNPVERRKFYGGQAIIVAFQGAQGAPPTVTRTKDEAKALADDFRSKLKGDNFRTLSQSMEKDVQFAPIPGFSEADPMQPEIKQALMGLKFGEVAPVIEMPMGFVVVERQRLARYSGAHILIAFKGAMRANPKVTRDKDAALKEAQDLIAKIKSEGGDFGEYARNHSDGPSAPKGGDLGTWWKGSMVPEFDEAIEGLKVGEISAQPVESPFGYHIIKRNPAR